VSKFSRAQAFTQWSSGQTFPQIPPKGLLAKMSPADLLKSEGLPLAAAIIKSAGEQSQGQAFLQGLFSQNSQRLISLNN